MAVVEAQVRDRGRNAEELVARARSLVPTLRERAARATAERRLPDATIAEMQRLELVRCLQPVMFGGYGSDYRVFTRVIRTLAQGCGSTAWVYGVFGEHNWLIGMFPEEAQRAVWGENPRALTASSFTPTGDCATVPGGFRLAGKWSFASGCDHAHWLLLGAFVDGDPAQERVFLVPMRAATVVDDWNVLGLAGTGSKTVMLRDVVVPAAHSLTPREMKAGTAPGAALHQGYPLYGAPRSLFSTFSLSSVPVGLAERAVEEFVAATRSRVSRGTRMAEVESMQVTVAEASARVEAAVAMVEATCARGHAAITAGETITTELVAWSKRNSAYATRLALEAVNAIFHVAGAGALRHDHPLQALFCDVNAGAAHLSLTWSRNARPYGQSRLGFPLDFEML
jgi:3-hydroxy-9,10-secoandrosta-1,3,5(10)-triene-9,17-dione monooxygenase